MWLLNVETRELKAFDDRDSPPYVILSHRWEDEEVTFQDMQNGQPEHKNGWRKIDTFCEQVSRDKFWLDWVWIDTCCIDKTNGSELSEAINSMYKWYEKAEVCVAYLSDVSSFDEFEHSAWFTRGWTLQELLAPSRVYFFGRDWNELGTKESLDTPITSATGIPKEALGYGFAPRAFSVADKMLWASRRQTARMEDMAYSLLGIFDVNMPLIYGEGKRAFYRLQEEILRTSEDLTIFAWQGIGHSDFEVLARSPKSFFRDMNAQPWKMPAFHAEEMTSLSTQGIAITSAGITINLKLKPFFIDTYLVPLFLTDDGFKCMAIARSTDGAFRKVLVDGKHLVTLGVTGLEDAQARRVVLGRGGMLHLGLAAEESRYKFEITNIDPAIPRFFREFSKQSAQYPDTRERIDLVSRFDASSDPDSLVMHAGAHGIAGMIRFTLYDSLLLLVIFGHDFDYNPFCLALSHEADSESQADFMTTRILPRGIRKSSLAGTRNADFQVASNSDMMALVSALQDNSKQDWNLWTHGVELHCKSWERYPRQPRVDWTARFIVAEMFQVRMIRCHNSFNYQVSIGPAPVTSSVEPAAEKVDEWHIQPWSQLGGT